MKFVNICGYQNHHLKAKFGLSYCPYFVPRAKKVKMTEIFENIIDKFKISKNIKRVILEWRHGFTVGKGIKKLASKRTEEVG